MFIGSIQQKESRHEKNEYKTLLSRLCKIKNHEINNQIKKIDKEKTEIGGDQFSDFVIFYYQ